MKILMVNKFLYPKGGAETYTLQLGEYLTAQGHCVEYFGMEHPENTVGNRWDIYTAPIDFHSNNFLSYATYPAKIIHSADAERKMRSILDVFQPDVLHINNFNYQLTPSILLAADKYRKATARKLRIIYTAHDSQLVCPNHLMFHPATKQVCDRCLDGNAMHCMQRKCIHNSFLRSCLGTAEYHYWRKRNVYDILDVILCPSAFLKNKLDTYHVLAKKTVLLRNFVTSLPKVDDSKENYVLFFGRYSEEKGIHALLRACQALPDIPFVFAGGGPLESLLEGIPNVRNVGFLQGEALHTLIRGARFTVVPSQCYENCPFSVMESILAGTPVLGSALGGIPELIEPGRTGWLFPADDATILQAEIQRIWNSNEPEQYHKACLDVQFDTLPAYTDQLMILYQGGTLSHDSTH